MKKSDLLRALQTEIRRHTFDTFVDQSPSIAQGGNGVVTPGSPACRKRLFTMAWIIWQMMSCLRFEAESLRVTMIPLLRRGWHHPAQGKAP